MISPGFFVCRLALAIAVGCGPLACAAATPDAWKDALYSYRGGSVLLGDRLEAFARTMGLALSVGGAAAAKLETAPDATAGSPSAYLDRLAAAHKLQWFVYNGRLYVSSAAASVTERLKLGNSGAADARQALVGLGLFEQKFGWGELDDSARLVFVSGPPAYVALVKAVVGKGAAERVAGTPQLMVFRLKYASAADSVVSGRDGPAGRPGLAAVLRGMLGGRSGRGPGADFSLRGPGPIARARMDGEGAAADAAGDLLPFGPAGGEGGANAPSIDAYAPRNAVLVRDLPERRSQYQELITALDVPVEQVEILVTIVDADTDKLREWSAGVAVGGATSGASSGALGRGGDANIVLWALDTLSLKLRALESEGALQIVSRPSVLTLDNAAAVLDMSESAYFRLVGERTVDLKSITVGTMLKVTPRVLGNGAESSIQVHLEIEDGTITNAGNQNSTPQTLRKAIATQAVVRPNQALVIGGYRRAHTEAQRSRVPVLAAIPLLGELFKSRSEERQQRERLYILTARVVGRE